MDAVETESVIERQPGESEPVFLTKKVILASQMELEFPLAHIHNVFTNPEDPFKTVVFLTFLGTIKGMLVPSAVGVSVTDAEIQSHPGMRLAVFLKTRIKNAYATMLKMMLEHGVVPLPPMFGQVYKNLGFKMMPRQDQIVVPDKRIKIARA